MDSNWFDVPCQVEVSPFFSAPRPTRKRITLKATFVPGLASFTPTRSQGMTTSRVHPSLLRPAFTGKALSGGLENSLR